MVVSHGVVLFLVLAVVFVNGWTDAPNAITCPVSTGVLPYGRAVRMAAVCNLLGIVVMGIASPSVASTVAGMICLDPARPQASMAALCAAMAAIVLFAVAAWYLGIPTSESHALVAALAGAGIALGTPVSTSGWGRVLAGLGLSVVLGFGLGYLCTRTAGRLLTRLGDGFSGPIQVLSAGAMAFMHGAQDGQKFMAVFLLANALGAGRPVEGPISLLGHPWTMVLVASVMALGTLTGGRRIVVHVGSHMVRLEKHQGASADIGGALCLLLASFTGIPMSTTHTKTTAMMGAGAAVSGSKVDVRVVRGMAAAWCITFPVCGLLGYLLTGVFSRFL